LIAIGAWEKGLSTVADAVSDRDYIAEFLFAAALDRLGNAVERRLGRVGDPDAPRTHCVVVVTVDGAPYRAVVLREFQRHKVPLHMDLEMPTIEAIRKMVQRNEGVAFLPRMCVDEEIRQGILHEVKVKEMDVDRKIRLVYPARRVLSHAAQAFLEVVGG